MNQQLVLEACQRLRSWQSEFPSSPPLTMSVNISAKDFAQPDLAGSIRKSMEQTGIDPSCLHLEIIETIAMGDAEKSGHVLAQLKALGVCLSIDDFGTGYSSLSRLRRIPVDTLKIDRAFIMHMDSDPESREIVRTIVMLAHNLGLKVVAEGAETEEHVNLLKQLNCEMVQGYFYSPPADDQAMSRLLANNHSCRAASVGG
jgi:EAL domain-containing protein (putative c-di-GMP-specific phosphodiesterase class I)